jgi:hypothetical protein
MPVSRTMLLSVRLFIRPSSTILYYENRSRTANIERSVNGFLPPSFPILHTRNPPKIHLIHHKFCKIKQISRLSDQQHNTFATAQQRTRNDEIELQSYPQPPLQHVLRLQWSALLRMRTMATIPSSIPTCRLQNRGSKDCVITD